MSYVQTMGIAHIYKLIEFAREQEAEERMWQTYLSILPFMNKHKPYSEWLEEYKREVSRIKAQKEINQINKHKSKEEILKELRGGNANGTV